MAVCHEAETTPPDPWRQYFNSIPRRAIPYDLHGRVNAAGRFLVCVDAAWCGRGRMRRRSAEQPIDYDHRRRGDGAVDDPAFARESRPNPSRMT